jgi:hypothetical protein
VKSGGAAREADPGQVTVQVQNTPLANPKATEIAPLVVTPY